MNSEFESKHKRDELGRFAKMSAKQISDTLKEEFVEHKFIEAKNGKIAYDSLTSRQWRMWYQEQTQREKSYLLNEYTLRRFVRIDDLYVLTNGDFVRPSAEAVFNFSKEESKKKFDNLLEAIYESRQRN